MKHQTPVQKRSTTDIPHHNLINNPKHTTNTNCIVSFHRELVIIQTQQIIIKWKIYDGFLVSNLCDFARYLYLVFVFFVPVHGGISVWDVVVGLEV